MTVCQKSWITSVALTLLCAMPLAAVTIGADVRQVSFDPKTGVAVFEISNVSTKDISAISMSVDVVYSDGTTRHSERLVDFWPAMMTKIDSGDLSPGSGSLHPGRTAQQTLGGSPTLRNGSVLQSVNAVVDVVVYVDQSAVVRNKPAFDRIVSVRQARANAITQVDAILTKHLASTEPDPVAAAEADLKSLLNSGSRPEQLESTEILATVDDLHHVPKNADKRDFLARYTEKKQKHLSQAATGAKIEVQQ